MRAITINKQKYPDHLESLFKDQRQKIETYRQLLTNHSQLSKSETKSGMITLVLFTLSFIFCFVVFEGNEFSIVSMILNVTIWYDIIRRRMAFKGRSKALRALSDDVNRKHEVIVLKLALLKMSVKK